MSTINHDDVGLDLRRVFIAGRLDTSGMDSISARLVELARGPQRGVVVDLSAVQFLASIGIAALISSAKTVKARGGQLALVVARDSAVMMSLEATGTDQFIPVFRKLADAEQAALA